MLIGSISNSFNSLPNNILQESKVLTYENVLYVESGDYYIQAYYETSKFTNIASTVSTPAFFTSLIPVSDIELGTISDDVVYKFLYSNNDVIAYSVNGKQTVTPSQSFAWKTLEYANPYISINSDRVTVSTPASLGAVFGDINSVITGILDNNLRFGNWAFTIINNSIVPFNVTYKYLFKCKYDGNILHLISSVLYEPNYFTEIDSLGTITEVEYLGEYYAIPESYYDPITTFLTIEELPNINIKLSYDFEEDILNRTILNVNVDYEYDSELSYAPRFSYRYNVYDGVRLLSESNSRIRFIIPADSKGTIIVTAIAEVFDRSDSINITIGDNSNPYAPGGNSGFAGGNGNFGVGVPNDNVTIDIPSGSDFGYVGGSMFTHYALSGNQVEHFGEWLWTDNLGLSLWKTVMEKIFNETADGLISLMAFPFNISTLPTVSLVDGTIKAGNLPTGIPARILHSPYTQVDWGTIQLTEYWGNFLDYAPHTKIELYLPWSTGFVPIDPHQCLPGSLSVKTNIDLQKGTCTHNVLAGTTVLGVYEGQVGYEIPLLASNFSAKLAGATVGAVAGLTMGVAGATSTSAYLGRKIHAYDVLEKARPMLLASSGGDLGLYQQAYAGLRQITMPSPYKEGDTYKAITTGLPSKLASASSVATARQPVNVSRNGSFSGSSAGMSVPYPYVIISRPEQNIPVGYGHYFGYPSNVGLTNMLQLKGYTEIGAIHLNGIRAVPDELAELDDILKGGFII